ncbi:MAG: flagellar protein FliT [Gammaproteobacteria bacterium]|nr:flagellar protein FliT [Gammaproteobacteria bacterium]MBU1415460.1 flagellar protein FliT [Gammaproteobacteria bacterium]
MTTSARAIENYETLLTLSRELREAAARGEWERLTEVQKRRAILVDAMAPIDSATSLDEPARRRKDALIEQILADEAETRTLVKSWMTQMQQAIQDGRQELRLLKEYRRHAG